jgi:HNH endonuclease
MKKTKLIQQIDVKKDFDYDDKSGILQWSKVKVDANKRLIGRFAGHLGKDGYLLVNFRGCKVAAHQLVWIWNFGNLPNGCIDHINGDKTDNRIVNLRDVTHKVNNENKHKARADSGTGVMGVFLQNSKRNPYRSVIKTNGRSISLGVFKTIELASMAYQHAKLKIHTGYVPATTN